MLAKYPLIISTITALIRDQDLRVRRNIQGTYYGLAVKSDGLFRKFDLITGINGKHFAEDARESLAAALEVAEATGQLNLLRWRDGHEEPVTLKMEILGTCSDTATRASSLPSTISAPVTAPYCRLSKKFAPSWPAARDSLAPGATACSRQAISFAGMARYGDHPPEQGNVSNGKSGGVAVALSLLDAPESARWFSQLAASANRCNLYEGHTGNFWNHLCNGVRAMEPRTARRTPEVPLEMAAGRVRHVKRQGSACYSLPPRARSRSNEECNT